MPLVAVMHVGEALEAPGQGPAHVLPALEPRAPGLAAPGHLQHAVLGEEAHDAVEVVRVEGVAQPLQAPGNVRHVSPFPATRRALTPPPAPAAASATSPDGKTYSDLDLPGEASVNGGP